LGTDHLNIRERVNLVTAEIAPKRWIRKKVEITMLAVAVVLVLSSSTVTGPGLAFAARAEGAGSDGGSGGGGKGSGGHDGDSNNVSNSRGTGKKVGGTDGGGGHGPPGSPSSSSVGHRESFPHPASVGKHLTAGGPPHRNFCLRSGSNCGSFDFGQRDGFRFVGHDDDHNTVVKIVHIDRNHNDRSVNFIVLAVDYTSPISGITYQAGERIPLSDFVPTVLPAPAASAAAAAVATAGGGSASAAAAAVAIAN
jgi:hypothetical protein